LEKQRRLNSFADFLLGGPHSSPRNTKTPPKGGVFLVNYSTHIYNPAMTLEVKSVVVTSDVPTPTLRERLLGEIEDAKNTYGENWSIEYFHSFSTILPCFPEDRSYRTSLFGNTAITDWRQRTIGNRTREEVPEYSDLYCSQTWGEFFAAIDQAIEEENLSLDEVRRLVHEVEGPERKSFEDHRAARDALYEYATPVYLRLREIGYNKIELTS
jgi:hypothetical protein